MNIILRTSDNAVAYVGNNLLLTAAEVHGGDWRDPSLTTANASVVAVDSVPGDFAPYRYTCTDGVWAYADPTYPEQRAVGRRTAIWEQIKALRDTKTQNGGFPAAGKWFHSDTFSRTQQIGLVMMGTNIPAGLQWKTMDGTFVTMTQTLAGQIFAAAAAQDAAMFAHAEALRAQIDATLEPDTVDITAGWPATYA